jgi:hypothetical protein
MDFQIFKVQLQGSKPIGLRSSLYHWKALGTSMSKIGLHDPFKHLKHKLWPKEGPWVKLAVWFSTTKIRESPQFPSYRWHATYRWKALDKGYNFSWDLISIKALHTKLWTPKVTKIPTLGISRLQLGTKWHLGASRVARHRIYYKEEGGGFPQVQAVVSLVKPWLPVAYSCTKMF